MTKLLIEQVTRLQITGAERLDPINVYLDESGSAGYLTVTCYGSSWTTYFSSMGSNMLSFIAGLNASYLLDRLQNEANKKRTKPQELYLLRIVEAIISAAKAGV